MDYWGKQYDKTICVAIKSKKLIYKYKDMFFGISLALFNDKEDCEVINGKDIEKYIDYEIIEIGE